MNVYRFRKNRSQYEHFMAAPSMSWAVQCFETQHSDWPDFDVSCLGPISIQYQGPVTMTCGPMGDRGLYNI